MSERKWVFVCGPYSSPSPTHNVHVAVHVGERLYEAGFFPVVPHALTHLWDSIIPRAYQAWLEFHRHALRKCDALFRIPGESNGADQEVQFARALGIPVYERMQDLFRDFNVDPNLAMVRSVNDVDDEEEGGVYK